MTTAPPPSSSPHVRAEDDARFGRALAALPFVLLGLSLVFTLGVGSGGRVPEVVALTVVTSALRVWQLGRPNRPHQVAAFVTNLLLTLLLVSLSPLYGVYAFVGYLDAVALFTGAGQVWALVAAASLNALAQSGGPTGVVDGPWVFAFLLLANAGLAIIMVQVDQQRQRTVTRLRQTLADLEQARRVNDSLQDQLVDQARTSGVLEERQRLSREIHDTVAQGLVALLRQIEAATDAATLPEARSMLSRADRTARDSLAEARRAVTALASPWLDAHLLPQALEKICSQWSQSSGVTVEVQVVGVPVPSPSDADLLRICQEGLANVSKHAHADHVELRLIYAQAALTLVLRDDGVGFVDADQRRGHGLRSMRDRLSAAGGQLAIDTSEGAGCTVRATVPR